MIELKCPNCQNPLLITPKGPKCPYCERKKKLVVKFTKGFLTNYYTILQRENVDFIDRNILTSGDLQILAGQG
ncbi:MAG: hypothetical protein DRZ76_01795, partial [Candidatus Nealsonbacteria bacterium]